MTHLSRRVVQQRQVKLIASTIAELIPNVIKGTATIRECEWLRKIQEVRLLVAGTSQDPKPACKHALEEKPLPFSDPCKPHGK